MSQGIKRALGGGSSAWFWLIVLATLVVYGLGIDSAPWDPWETHYSEVARNILRRSDPLDLWWKPGVGPDGKKELVFASKHALPFWCTALSMKLFGVGLGAPDELVRPPIPEIAIRLPVILMGLGSAVFLGWTTARMAGRRAGVLVYAVLATMPLYAMLGRQAVTDMYFVGPVSIAIASWASAWYSPVRELKRRDFALGRWKPSLAWDRALLGWMVLIILAGLLPLAVLHQHVVDDFTIRRVSRFAKSPRIPSLADLDRIAQQLWLYWAFVAVILARALQWRSTRQLWLGTMYIAGGLALMGKGLLGPGIIGLFVLVELIVHGHWERLWRAELPVGVLIFVLCCFPWHHAQAIYRGESWVRELLIENNLARFSAGEQDQAVGSFAFYLRTLGLAAWPWSALVPAVVFRAVADWRGASLALWEARSLSEEERREAGARAWGRVALLWFLLALGVISYSVTKYYHYLAPVLPPLALLCGLWMDAVWRSHEAVDRARSELGALVTRCVVVALALWVLGSVMRELLAQPAWLAHLTTYLYTGMWLEGAPETKRAVWISVPFALGLVLWLANRARAAVVALVLSGWLGGLWVLGDYVPAAGETWSQRSALTVYFDEKKEGDQLLSWWFYYRGETYFSKADIWVQAEPGREALHGLIDEARGQGKTFWFITTRSHAKRLRSHLPRDLRSGVETVYENFHYSLVRVPIA